MLPKYRVGLSIILIMILAAALLGVGGFDEGLGKGGEPSLGQAVLQTKGVVQVYMDSIWVGGFASSVLERLPILQSDPTSDASQISGWSLRDALLLLVSARQLKAETRLVITSQRQRRSLVLTWGQVEEVPNAVLLRKRADGELEVIAHLPFLPRAEQQLLGVDRIELNTP